MSPRTGRPKIENPKVEVVKVRIDEETSNKLKKYCKDNDITRTEAIRQGIGLVLGGKKE